MKKSSELKKFNAQTTWIGKNKIFEERKKNKKCPKTAFDVATLSSDKLRMSVCGREFHTACMRGQNSSFEATGRECRRQGIYDADISISVAVHERAANFLKEAVWSFTIMLRNFRLLLTDANFRRPLQVFRVVWWLLVHKLASLWNNSAANNLLLYDKKVLLLEGRYFPD